MTTLDDAIAQVIPATPAAIHRAASAIIANVGLEYQALRAEKAALHGDDFSDYPDSRDGAQFEWKKPARSASTRSTPPPCPLDTLPPTLRRFVEEVARSTETSPDLATVLALGAVSGAICRADVVRGGHREPVVLWGLPLAESGSRKSEVVRVVRQPIDAAATLLRDDPARRAALAARQAEHEAAVARTERAKKALREKGSRAGGEPDRVAQQSELADAEATLMALGARPELPVLAVADITPERLGQIIESNGAGGIGEVCVLAGAESSLDAVTGRRHESAPALLLACHAGDSFADQRVGRRGVTLGSPRLAVLLACQPVVLRELLADTGLADRGLAARFAVVTVADDVHTKTGPSPEPADNRLTAPCTDRITALALASATFQQSPKHPHRHPMFTIPNTAGTPIREFEIRLARRMAPGADLSTGTVRAWAAKAHGLAQRLAAVLHAIGIDDPQPWRTPVPAETVADAVRIVEQWLLPHAISAFVDAQPDPVGQAADAILGWLQRNPTRTRFTASQAFEDLRRGRKWERTDDTYPALDLAETLGWVRQVDAYSGVGRRPSRTYDVSPHLPGIELIGETQ